MILWTCSSRVGTVEVARVKLANISAVYDPELTVASYAPYLSSGPFVYSLVFRLCPECL